MGKESRSQPGRDGLEVSSEEKRQVTPVHEAERELVKALRSGSEDAFRGLVELHHAALVRVAAAQVSNLGIAEEIAQETWLAVVKGIHCFEGRSSLKTWLFRILLNIARKRRTREWLVVNFSGRSAGVAGGSQNESQEALERYFRLNDQALWIGRNREGNRSPESLSLARETRLAFVQALKDLPSLQRTVVTMRDVEDWTGREVSEALGVSMTYQRVLLHRGRRRIRKSLRSHYGSGQLRT